MGRHRNLNFFCAKELSYNMEIVFRVSWKKTQSTEDAIEKQFFIFQT